MTTIPEGYEVKYCSKCGGILVHIAFNPDKEIKLQCIKCDRPA